MIKIALNYNTDSDAESRGMQFLHCSRCIGEMPRGMSPREWARLEVAMTPEGIEVRCVRHEMNVAQIEISAQLEADDESDEA